MTKEYKKVKLKNGEVRYVFDVSLGVVNGRRKRTTIRAKTVKEGRQKVAELQLKERQIISNNSMLFKDAYALYIDDCKRDDQAPNTIRRKEHNINIFQPLAECKLSQITDRDIQHYIDNLNMIGSSKRIVLGALGTFFKWCINHKLIDKSPCEGIRKPKKETYEKAYLTEDEFKDFLNYVNDETEKLLFEILFYTGLRKSELCGLSATDLIGNELHLSHALKMYTPERTTLSTRFKNRQSRRIVPIPKSLSNRLKMAFESSNEQYPFAAYYNVLSIRPLQAFNKGFPKRFRTHDLRHSYASLLIHKGVDIFTVSKLLGHSNVATTSAIYGHLYDADRKAIVDLFD